MADAVNAVSREMHDARRKIDSFGSTLYHMDLATLSKETQMQLHHFQSVLHHSDMATLPEATRNKAQHYEDMMRNSDMSAISDDVRKDMDSFFSRLMGDVRAGALDSESTSFCRQAEGPFFPSIPLSLSSLDPHCLPFRLHSTCPLRLDRKSRPTRVCSSTRT